jgi:hypothetical protein
MVALLALALFNFLVATLLTLIAWELEWELWDGDEE